MQIIGAQLDDRYEIIDVISSGGVGDVYKVRHREMDKVYAAKVMHASAQPTPESIRRFQREAQILCKLRHPNIVSVHAFGNDQQFGPYLIMDLLEGVNLHSLVKERGALPLERAGKLLIGICEGMSNAHNSIMPAPPSVANPKAKLPEQIDQVITLAMRKQPDERLDTFTKIKEALEIAMQRPTYAKMFGLGAMMQDRAHQVSRRQVGVIASVLVLMLIAGGLFFTVLKSQNQLEPPTVVEKDTSREYQELKDKFNELAIHGTPAAAVAVGLQAIKLPRFKTDSPQNKGAFLLGLASSEYSAGRFDDSLDHLKAADELLGDDNVRNISDIAAVRARCLIHLQRPKEAEAAIGKALQRREYMLPEQIKLLELIRTEAIRALQH